MPKPQWGRQKYENVPADVNVWLYIEPEREVGADAQLVSFGEQNVPSAVQLVPLVTV